MCPFSSALVNRFLLNPLARTKYSLSVSITKGITAFHPCECPPSAQLLPYYPQQLLKAVNHVVLHIGIAHLIEELPRARNLRLLDGA